VVKVAVVYAGVAFVIVQTADLVFRGLVLPEWTYTLLVVFALFGFPIALVLAWAFDVTSEGVRRTEPLGAVAAAPATAPARRPGGPPADGDGPAIVVLPFQNLSADPEDEYFTEGVTEDITARIAALQGVRVISRTSAARYRGTARTVPEIEALLAEHGQELAFEPMDYGPLLGGGTGNGTIGGILAANLSGPRRIKAGAARDHILGVHAVSGRGEAFKSGGRVVKNVTGYDLSKGLAGSWGTLAVVSDVTFKVLPAAETETTLVLRGLTEEQAAFAMAAA
jgi:hypothetical protein